MSITQKKIKKEIATAEDMIEKTVLQSEEVLEEIRQQKKDSNAINMKNDSDLNDNIDVYNGLNSTMQYYTGHLNALEWVLKEMKAKNKKRSKKSKE